MLVDFKIRTEFVGSPIITPGYNIGVDLKDKVTHEITLDKKPSDTRARIMLIEIANARTPLIEFIVTHQLEIRDIKRNRQDNIAETISDITNK